MVIYLKHPVHGTKVAVQESEASYDESLGWVRFTYPEKLEDVTEPVIITNQIDEIVAVIEDDEIPQVVPNFLKSLNEIKAIPKKK